MIVRLPFSEVCQPNYPLRNGRNPQGELRRTSFQLVRLVGYGLNFVTVSYWSVCGYVLLSEAWRYVCRPTCRLLLLTPLAQSKVVRCQQSYILVHHIHAVDLILPVLRPPDWPCSAGLVSCQRVWSVHCLQSATKYRRLGR